MFCVWENRSSSNFKSLGGVSDRSNFGPMCEVQSRGGSVGSLMGAEGSRFDGGAVGVIHEGIENRSISNFNPMV